jgi:hypothetical protein
LICSDRHHRFSISWLLLGVLLWLPATSAVADEFEVTRMDCVQEGDFYLLYADIEYRLSDKALEALNNGIPLTLGTQVRVSHEWAWGMWDRKLLDRELRFQLSYHALAALYQLEDLQTGEQQSFATLEAAIAALGEIRSLPVLSTEELEPGKEYQLEIQSYLDIDALPLPLRPMAYITPAWNLSSEWTSCRIQH